MSASKGGAIRTNLTVLAITAAQVMAGVFFVVYGSPGALDQIPLAYKWYWTALVLAMGVGGVLMFIAKGILGPRWFRLSLGIIGILPLVSGIGFAFANRVAAGFVYAVLAAIAMMYALWNDEPEPTGTPRMLLTFFAGALLIFQPFAFLVLKGGEAPAVPLPFMFTMSALGAYAVWAHVSGPDTTRDAIGRYGMAAAFAVLAAGAYLQEAPVMAITYAPYAIILAAHDFFKGYRLGLADKPGVLSDEARIVRQFEALAEMLAWATFVFTYVHMLYRPDVIAIRHVLFLLFAGAFAIFSVQYRLFRPERMNFGHMYRTSMLNTVLLAIICHFTGGLTSPYNWFFVFILLSGSIAPQPIRILHRLGTIFGYYLFETAYFAANGFMTRDLLVNHLVLQAFILGLMGMYAYHLSVRRQKIDTDFLSVNIGMRETLEREQAAKAMVERQAGEIDLAKKRDDALLAALADGVIGFDEAGRITSLNPAAEGLIGSSFREALGKRLSDVIRIRREADEDFLIGRYIDTASRGDAVPLPEDIYVERDGGGKLYLTGVVLPIMDERGRVTGMVVTLSDVTYTREVDQMKTGFLSVAAHQLRTPLSTIRWYLELLNDPSEGKLKKNQKMFAENAYLSLRKMVGLVNRLLAVTRLEAGRVPFRPEPTDLKAMTKGILESLKPALTERRLDIRAELPDLPAVPLDPTLAREVFVNLIENAIRYTPDGGRIVISARDEGDRIAWSVTDTGIGIPQAQQDKIFEKFFRAVNAVEHSSEGSGLGLYLAKFIVDVWGGTIGFVSGEGKGAEFRVTVPKAGMKSKGGHVSLNA